MSVPKILDEALRAYFDGEVQDSRNTALLQRLELMSRHDHRQSRDIAIVQEALALFVQYFFTITPDMKGGGRNIKNALQDVLVTDADFFTAEELERFGAAGTKKVTAKRGEHASA